MLMLSRIGAVCAIFCISSLSLRADSDVYLLEVPDYSWYAGCFGTATGNLMGYWDRHGLPDFYTGFAGGGLAPLRDATIDDQRIRSMWANREIRLASRVKTSEARRPWSPSR